MRLWCGDCWRIDVSGYVEDTVSAVFGCSWISAQWRMPEEHGHEMARTVDPLRRGESCPWMVVGSRMLAATHATSTFAESAHCLGHRLAPSAVLLIVTVRVFLALSSSSAAAAASTRVLG